jgi:hypothetical protein
MNQNLNPDLSLSRAVLADSVKNRLPQVLRTSMGEDTFSSRYSVKSKSGRISAEGKDFNRRRVLFGHGVQAGRFGPFTILSAC